jgi:two-component system CheB/CheR fusion protein
VRENARQAERADQLTVAHGELIQANRQLTREITELRGQNEEYMLGNEELQAASEEIETLNEELQATNEELETLNEELQATVEELNTTNDDLQAQSAVTQDLAVKQKAERAQFEAMLVSMADALLVANRVGEIILKNAAYDRLFPDGGTPPGVLDDGGKPLPGDQLPQQRAARGESFRMMFRMESDEGGLRTLEAIGQPFQGEGDGAGVLVIRDVSERARQESGEA